MKTKIAGTCLTGIIASLLTIHATGEPVKEDGTTDPVRNAINGVAATVYLGSILGLGFALPGKREDEYTSNMPRYDD